MAGGGGNNDGGGDGGNGGENPPRSTLPVGWPFPLVLVFEPLAAVSTQRSISVPLPATPLAPLADSRPSPEALEAAPPWRGGRPEA